MEIAGFYIWLLTQGQRRVMIGWLTIPNPK